MHRHEEQYTLFLEIVQVYENDENNMTKLLDLMTKAQDYGQPPPEIVNELVPDGGAAGAGGLEGLMGLGGAGGTDPEACVIS